MISSPTFASLQLSSNIAFRKIVSAFFLLLFVAIHIVKAFHHHSETTAAIKYHSGIDSVKASSTCAICDYHFTKDADTVTNFAVVQPRLTYVSGSFFYILPSTTSIGLPGTDRGPPAIV